MKGQCLKKIAFGLLATMLVVLAFATILEKLYNQDFVLSKIYHSWWFVMLWGAIGLISFIYIICQKLYRQKTIFFLHCTFIIILIGAFTTFLSSERGYIHLRQGKPLNEYILEDDITKQPLPFEIKLVLFEMEYHADTDQPSDYISYLMVDGEMCKVSMNKIYVHQDYRLYQIDYDSDEMGTVLLVYHDPLGIGITYMGYLLLALTMICLLWSHLGWKGLSVIIISLLGLWYYISQINPMTPILRTPLLAVHVSVIMLAYFLFLVIMIFSVIGISTKKQREKLYNWSNTLLQPALYLLIAGIFIGAVWANISWGRYWGWDAKETWALITMFVYIFPLHKKSLPRFKKPIFFHRYCLIAFLSVLMTFLGVSFILGGIHSYL